MSKEQVLGQVTSTRRRFLQRLVTGVALAIPASAILKAQQEPEGKGKGKKGKGKKGKGKKGEGKGDEGKGKGNE